MTMVAEVVESVDAERRERERRRRGPRRWLRSIWIVTHNATGGLFRHDGVMVASAISYSLIFALFPFLIFVVGLGAFFGGNDLADYVTRESLAVFPEQMVRTIEPELRRIFGEANQASPLTIGLLVTLISITGAVEAVRDGLNRAYGCPEDRPLWKRYLSSLLFVFMSMAFIIAVAALGIAVPIWIRMIGTYLPGPPMNLNWLEVARQAALVLVLAVMIGVIHLFLPARKRRVKNVAWGATITLVGWWIAGRIFGFYISRIADYTTTYAGLAGIVALMFFLYIQSIIFLYGAEVNRSIADLRGINLCRAEPD